MLNLGKDVIKDYSNDGSSFLSIMVGRYKQDSSSIFWYVGFINYANHVLWE